MASPEMYDTALLGILQHEGKIENFLDTMFGFLYRRTDFFRTMRSKEDRMGFPPGVQEKMLYSIFKKWQQYATQDEERMLKKLQEQAEKERQATAAASAVVEEVEVETTSPEQNENKIGDSSSAGKTEVQTHTTSKVDTAPTSTENTDGHKVEGKKERTGGEIVGSESVQKDSSKTDEKAVEEEGAKKEVAPVPASQEEFQMDAESWNGAVRENYKWAQHMHEVEVRVHVPQNIKKAKDCVVDIRNNFLKVGIKDGGQVKVLMEGKLTNKIICEESMWSLEPGRCVQVNLEKEKEYWWKAVLVGEPEIDIQKIEPIKHMHDMDAEEQAGVQRMMFDQHQKMMGKPQSHEMKVHDMLKKGWDAPGSPFAGQDFDPTKFNISPGAVQM